MRGPAQAACTRASDASWTQGSTCYPSVIAPANFEVDGGYRNVSPSADAVRNWADIVSGTAAISCGVYQTAAISQSRLLVWVSLLWQCQPICIMHLLVLMRVCIEAHMATISMNHDACPDLAYLTQHTKNASYAPAVDFCRHSRDPPCIVLYT